MFYDFLPDNSLLHMLHSDRTSTFRVSNHFGVIRMAVMCILEQEFDCIDKNHDGYLSRNEIMTCLERFGFPKNKAEVSSRRQILFTLGFFI
ncbi:unnamed protein product [Heterobilharzia americana]|nr:unnamed protein product [Heterobilharzia americana]